MEKTNALFLEINQRKTKLNMVIILFLLILLATLFRLYKLGDHSLWDDEAASVRNVRAILQEPGHEDWGLFRLVTKDRMPPLYPLYLISFYYLSSGEWIMRFAAVIWGLLSIPLLYCFGSRLSNRATCLVAALLLTFSPFHIYHSQALRHYTLFLFLATALFYFSYLALKDNRNIYYAGMILAAGLGLYTHIYIIFPLGIVNLYFILNWKANHIFWPKWLLAHLIIVILWLPELYLLAHHIMQGNTELMDVPPSLRTMAGTFYVFTMGPVLFLNRLNLIFLVIQAIIFGVGFLLGIWALWKERTTEGGRPTLLFFLAAGIVYVAIILFSFTVTPLLDESRQHYLIFLLPFYYLLVARGWNALSNPALKTTLVSLAISISLISIYPFYFQWDQVGKGNFRAAAEYVKHYLQENDVIYHTNRGSSLPFSYYLDWSVPQTKEISDLVRHDRIWLVALRQESGLSFGLKQLQKRSINSQEQRGNHAVHCNRYIKDENLQLVDFETFPGKNELIVCLFERTVRSPEHIKYVPSNY